MAEVLNGDCIKVMKTFPDNHFSSIVTDPPYGLKFLGKEWDHGLPGKEFWVEALRISKPGAFLLAFGGTRTYHRLTCAIEDAGWEIRDCIMWIYGSGFPKSKGCLKPAYEPIILARKKGINPRLNIDACRIGSGELRSYSPHLHKSIFNDDSWKGKDSIIKTYKGRWPSNVILDEESADVLDEQRRSSRFFYCAKASPSEKAENANNIHPTVKPIKLMEYLVKLVSPLKDGILLDPFCGSGSTLLAAKNLGIEAIGIEKEEEYVRIANRRLCKSSNNAVNQQQEFDWGHGWQKL